MKKFYLPLDQLGKQSWFANFASKLPEYAALLDIPAATVSQVQTNAAALKIILYYLESVKSFTEGVTAYKNQLLKGDKPLGVMPPPPALPVLPAGVQHDAIGKARKLVRMIKAHEKYSDPIGSALGIIGAEVKTDTHAWKPILKAKKIAGYPVIQWKKGQASGIKLFVDRGDGKGFQYLNTDMLPPFPDKHPLPELGKAVVWKYMAVYLLNDEPTGEYSNELEVTVTGRNV